MYKKWQTPGDGLKIGGTEHTEVNDSVEGKLTLQVDTSRWFKPPVDIKTQVPF